MRSVTLVEVVFPEGVIPRAASVLDADDGDTKNWDSLIEVSENAISPNRLLNTGFAI
jgi:hypothetical protein